MAIKDWEVDMKAPIGKLEELLFEPEVKEVTIEGGKDISYVRGDEKREVAAGTTFPKEIMRDFANELLLVNIDFKNQRALHAGSTQPPETSVSDETQQLWAALKLRSPFHSGRAIYVRMESHWNLETNFSSITLTK